MKNLGIAVTTATLLSGATYVQAANQLETVMDLAFREMIDEGAEVTYDDRIIGGDGSVEYKNLVIADPDDETIISVAWIKGVPLTSDPETVTFTMADTLTLTAQEEGEEFTLELRTAGMSLTTNALLREAMSTDEIHVVFTADSFIIDGGDPDNEYLRKVFADLGGVDFNMLMTDDDSHVAGDINTEKFDVTYDITTDGDTQTSEQSLESVSMSFEFDVPSDEEDALGYLDGSKSAVIKMESGKAVYNSSVEAEGMAFQMTGTGAGSTAFIEMADGTFTYDVRAGTTAMTITPGENTPFPPIDISMASMVMKAVVPMNSADAADEAVLNVQVSELTVGEELWAMIDPDKTISRDPATVDIDLAAMVQIDSGVAIAGGDPLELATVHKLDVNQILLEVAGASAQADGAVTFNNDGPIPVPVGDVRIELNGLSALSNQLVSIGLLDQMEAAMMMGMVMTFAKAGKKSDQFVSEITFTKDGEILANGQPVQ